MKKNTIIIASFCLQLLACSGEAPRLLKQDISELQLQQTVEQMIAEGQYEEATDYLESIDIKHVAVTGRANANIQYWGVMEDGLTVPRLDEFNLSIEQLIALERNCWVFPGTSDAQNPGPPQAWQTAAYESASLFNKTIHEQYAAPSN